MSCFLDLCKLRRSVRNYSSKPVPGEMLDYVMECVRLAPSAVNFQPWHFIEVGGQERCRLLQQCYNREWFRTAPHYFIVCRNKEQEWVRKTDAKPHGDIDVSIAVEHFCLATAEQGLGTCWVCNFDVALCKELFDLPAYLEPVVLLPVGFPVEESVDVPKSRKSLDEIWQKPDAE